MPCSTCSASGHVGIGHSILASCPALGTCFHKEHVGLRTLSPKRHLKGDFSVHAGAVDQGLL